MIVQMVLIIIGMILSFTAYAICTFAKPSEKQKYSSITSIAALFFFIINFMILYCDNVDQFILCQKLSFTAGIYMMIGFALTISYIFQIKYSAKTKLIMLVISILFVCLFAAFDNYYPWVKSIDMVLDEKSNLYTFKVHGGWLYYLLSGLSIVTLIAWSVIVIVLSANKRGKEFKVFRYLLGFALAPLFVWIFSVFKILPSLITNELVFMLLLIVIIHVEIFFSLSNDKMLTNDCLFKNSSNGIIILDYKKRFVSANKAAKDIFEILKSNNKDAATAFINVNLIGEDSFYDGKNYYRMKFEEIEDDNNPREGFVLWICRIENDKASE